MVSANRQSTGVKVLVALSFVVMVTVNVLANLLPLNGQTTGAVSDAYPNLFAPAGFTFGIWGLIYLLLAGFTLFQLGLFRERRQTVDAQTLNRIGLWFTLSSLANSAWIFAWHYNAIGWSLLLMAVILISLIAISLITEQARLSQRERFFVRLPFSIYFGWITVATIANVTTFLVSLGWSRFGLTEATWTVVIVLVGLLIGAVTAVRQRYIAYGLVLVWAYVGILVKHLSPAGWAGQFPAVMIAVGIGIALLLAVEIYLVRTRRQDAR